METREQMCEICSKLRIKTPEGHQWLCFGVIIIDFEQVNAGWDCNCCGLKFLGKYL